MNWKEKWKFYKSVFIESGNRFGQREAFTYAAGLSYYTIFSLPPMLMVILYTTTLFYNRDTIRDTIFGEISEIIGQDSASQLAATLENIGVFQGNWINSAISIAALIFTSTTVFLTMQRGLNRMYGVQPKPSSMGIFKMLLDRLTSFALLLGIAFVMLVSLVLNTIISEFGGYLSEFIPGFSWVVAQTTNLVLPFLIITVLFMLLFRFLPDVRLYFRDCFRGALLTSLLFALGRYLISFYISQSRATDLYDAAGSVMVIMLWVFYASLILIFGGTFTAVYAEKKRGEIKTTPYAIRVEYQRVEQEDKEQ